MIKTLLIVLFLIPFSGFAQFNPPVIDSLSSSDSITYYERRLSELRKKYDAAMRNDAEAIEAMSRLRELKRNADTYNGFILYTQAAQANFNKVNEDLAASGFPAFSGQLWGVGYGFTFKEERRIIDFYMGAFGIPKWVEKDGEKIKLSFGTFIELIGGYDFIKSKSINLYPYVGLGFRLTEFQYQAKIGVNPTPNGVTDIITDNKSFNERSGEFAYQGGIGLEVVLTGPDRDGGTLLFVTAGTNRPFKTKAIEIAGYKYQPSLKTGELIFKAGFKFFFR